MGCLGRRGTRAEGIVGERRWERTDDRVSDFVKGDHAALRIARCDARAELANGLGANAFGRGSGLRIVDRVHRAGGFPYRLRLATLVERKATCYS